MIEAQPPTKDDGFTLVELLITIVILGILAAVVLFGIVNFQLNAKKSACASDVSTVTSAASAYLAAPGAPATIPGATSTDRITTLTTAKYLSADVTTTNGYTIALAADGTVSVTVTGGGTSCSAMT